MDTLFLLRSYGDFVVALSGYQHEAPERKVAMVASVHLQPLYDAIVASGVMQYLPDIQFVDIGIQHGIFSCFTNRYFFSADAINEVRALRRVIRSISPDATLWLEQNERVALISGVTGKRFSCIHDGHKNIYAAYRQFLDVSTTIPSIEPSEITSNHQVLIFPGSRKKSKQLPVDWVNHVIDSYFKRGVRVTVAGLATEITHYSGNKKVVKGFKDLCEMIASADQVISADSLPAHLAFLFRKPLEVHYKVRINEPWLPPGAKAIIL